MRLRSTLVLARRRATSAARRPHVRLLCAVLAILGAIASCRDGDGAGPLPARSVAFGLRPYYAVTAASAPPINVVRLVAREEPGGDVLGSAELTVDPAASEWPLTLEVDVPGGVSVNVTLTIELLSRDGAGASTVEWSGRTDPIEVRPTSPTEVADVALGRGPLENLLVTGVELSAPRLDLVEGDEVRPAVAVTGAPGALVFWGALDDAVATVDATGLVRTLRDGTARIVASAGTRADTITFVVGAAPASITFSQDSLRLSSLGAEAAMGTRVLDARGAEVAGAPLVWSVADAAIAASLGGGVYRAVANGVTAITATVAGRPSVTRTTGLRVTQAVASLTVSPRSATLAGVGASAAVEAAALDANGHAVAGATVQWESADQSVARVSAAGTVTAAGRGSTFVRASSGGARDSASVTVTAGAPATVTRQAGDGQTATVGAAPAVAPSVRVTDATGIPVTGATVTFAVESGGGTLTGATATTGEDGVATAGAWTLGTRAGANALSATVAGLPPATFSATGVPAAPASIEKHAGDGQTARAGAAVPTPPAVVVRDAFGNPVTGTPVTFAIASGGGNVTGATPTTDAAGAATAGSWTLGTTAGANTLTASAAGRVATFTATGVAGSPTSLTKQAGDAQVVVVGNVTPVTPAVVVKDASGNPVGGVTVTFAPAAGSTLMGSATSLTGSDGIARASGWFVGPTAGAKSLTATVAGPGLAVTFSATAVAGPATTLAGAAGNGQTARVGTAVATPPAVRASDQFGNPVAGVQVTFAVASGGGSVTGTAATTGANGVATVGVWTLGTSAGTNTMTASAGTLAGSPVTFTATGTAAAPSRMVVFAGDGQTATVGAAVATAPAVRVTDANGNPVTGVPVTFTPSAGGSISGSPATTDANGVARVASWVLSGTAGANTLSAAATGTSLAAGFTATAVAGPAAAIAKTAGDGQSAPVGSAVAVAPAVRVTDARGNPVAGVAVTFAVTAGGGSVTGSATRLTGTDGVATIDAWNLGTAVGANALAASIAAPSLTVTFTATAAAGPAASLAMAGGDGQVARVGTPVATPPSVRVADAFGNPVAGVTVTFAVATGGGSVAGGSAVSGAAGIASVGGWTLGTAAGANTLTARSGTLTGSPVTFSATGTPDVPGSMVVWAGGGQTTTVGTMVAVAPAVRVTDAHANPVSGVTVTFAVTGGGGSLAGSPATTNASGVATVASWTLGTTAGANALTASAASLPNVTFGATGTPGPPAAIAIAAGDAQSAQVGSAVATAPAVRVRDAFGNAVAGVPVTFAVASGGGSVTGAASVTNASGVATVGSWTLGPTAGPNALAASSSALPGTVVSFNATGTRAAASVMTAVAGDAQSATAGSAVAIPPAVRVADAFGNPVPDVPVTFAVASGGGSVTGAAAITNASGVATAGSWTLGATAGANSLTASAAGVPAVTFRATGTPGAPASLAKRAGDGQTAAVGSTLPIAPSVIVRDAHANPVAGATVRFAVQPGSGSLAGNRDVVTGADGVATAGAWTLGTLVGTHLVDASIVGEDVNNVVFTATATRSTAIVLVVVSGDGQSGSSLVALEQPLVARVQDAFGNPAPGVVVAWTTSHDGTLSPTTGTTDALGRVQTSFTPGFGSTAQTVTASAAGLTSVTFPVSVTVPPVAITLRLRDAAAVGVGFGGELEITLSRPAPAGVFIVVTSDNPDVSDVDTEGTTILAGETTGSMGIRGISPGTATFRAGATGYAEGTVTVRVVLRSVTLPATLSVPLTRTATLPVTLSEPAPAGGLTVTLASADPTKVELQTGAVFVAAGATTGSATVLGRSPGVTRITATAPNYTGGASDVTTTASLNVLQTTSSFLAGSGADIQVSLESNATPAAAPAPGVTVSFAAVAPACVAVVAGGAIPTGQTSVSSRLTYGGSAPLPCTTWVRATAADIQPDSVSVTVNPPLPIAGATPVTLGAGLMVARSVTLGTASHGGVTVRVVSSDPARVLVSPSATTAGSASIDVPVANGTANVAYFVHALETPTGSTTVVASAAGFVGFSQTVNVVQPAIDLVGLATSTTTTTSDDAFQVRTGTPFISPQGVATSLSEVQAIRVGGTPLSVTLSSSLPSVATLITMATVGGQASVQVASGQSASPATVLAGGVALRPVAQGNTVVQATAPGFRATSAASVTVSVSTPTFRFVGSPVGSGLQNAASVQLTVFGSTSKVVTLTSGSPQILLLSPDATTPGASSIQVTIPGNTTTGTFYLHGIERQTGTAQVTATASGYVSASMTASVVAPAVELVNLAASQSTSEPPVAISARVGTPLAGSGPPRVGDVQEVRAGASEPLTATFTSGDVKVARLVTSGTSGASATAEIKPGQSVTPATLTEGGVAYEALAAGTSLVSVTIPGFTATAAASVTTTVTSPALTMFTGGGVVGAGLQDAVTLGLGAAAPAGGLVVRITGRSPTVAIASASAADVGAGSIDLAVPAGATTATWYIQALEDKSGVASFDLSAPGYTGTSYTITVVATGVALSGLPSITTALTPDDPFMVQVGPQSAGTTGGLSDVQAVRAGAPGPLVVTITSVNTQVASLVTTTSSGAGSVTMQLAPGQSASPPSVNSGGVALRPLSFGTATITAGIPGYTATQSLQVGTPSIQFVTLPTVGAGLQAQGSARLGTATQHGGLTVTLRSANSQAVLLSPDGIVVGAASITVFVPNGSSDFTFFVQGALGTSGVTNISASALGYNSTSAGIVVQQAAIEVFGFNTIPTAGGPDIDFRVRVGLPDAFHTLVQTPQAVRAGGGPITATVTIDSVAVGVLKTTQVSGAQVTVSIPSGQSTSPLGVASGGVAFDPIAAGTANVKVSAGGFVTAVSASSGTGTGIKRVTVQP
ncbi:MAG: beta strand repeat-containing protein [Gemmatimonadaceae bacterium]